MKTWHRILLFSMILLIVSLVVPFVSIPVNNALLIEISVVEIVTFVFSAMVGWKENKRIKFLFPFITMLVAAVSAFHYNTTAISYIVWILEVSFGGIIIGWLISIIAFMLRKKKQNSTVKSEPDGLKD